MSDKDVREAVARAIDAVQVGYSIELTRLVDGVSTYTLTFSDSPRAALAFYSHEAAYEEVTQRRRMAQAAAAITAYEAALKDQGLVIVPAESTRAMYEAGDAVAEDAWQGGYPVDADAIWTAMLSASQPKGE